MKLLWKNCCEIIFLVYLSRPLLNNIFAVHREREIAWKYYLRILSEIAAFRLKEKSEYVEETKTETEFFTAAKLNSNMLFFLLCICQNEIKNICLTHFPRFHPWEKLQLARSEQNILFDVFSNYCWLFSAVGKCQNGIAVEFSCRACWWLDVFPSE